MSEPKIPNDLKALYLSALSDACTRTGESQSSQIVRLIERITALEAESSALRAQVERLSAPISHGEVDEHFHRDDWGVPCIYAERFNAIIAARAAGEGKRK